MNRQELINENLDECAVIRECDAGTDAIERLAAVIAERDKLKNLLIYVIEERDELKISMRLWKVVAIVNAVVLFINAVVLFITTFAF